MADDDTLICAHCGAGLTPGVKFCKACGSPIEAVADTPTGACPQCRHVNRLGDRFCRRCGTQLDAATLHTNEPATEQMPSQQAVLLPSPPSQVGADWPAPPPVGAAGRPAPQRRLGLAAVVAIIASLLLVCGAAVAAVVVLTHKSSPPQPPAPAAAVTVPAETTATTETTETTPTQTETTESHGVLPAESTEQMEASIQQTLYTWHEDVVRSDYRGAWNLLSERKRQETLKKERYSDWVKNQATLKPYLDPSGIKISIEGSPDEQTGEVTVDVTGMTWSAPGAKCSEWSGITWVLYENGGWHYDPGYSTTPQREAEWKHRYQELLGGSC